MSPNTPEDLQRIYDARFRANLDYRLKVWRVLIGGVFQRFVSPADSVLDLGCGYGEFINQINCRQKFAMDLNPDVPSRLANGVRCFGQDCSERWPLDDQSLDVVFTSNFFEHLPDKPALARTLDQIARCLRKEGRLIALGPNIRFLPGSYWDFWDHYLPLTERSLGEGLENRQFQLEICCPKFLPYTMAHSPRYPLFLLRSYLKLKIAWRLLGRQFLIVAVKN